MPGGAVFPFNGSARSRHRNNPLPLPALRHTGLPKIRPAELLQVGGSVTLAFLWCNTCVWEIDQTQLYKPHGRAALSAIAALAAVAASSGTYMDQRGGQEGFHRQLPLVQLAAYPEYDGKRDQHRERHSHAGAHVPEHNEFPDCHGEERSLATVIGPQGKAPAPLGVAREGRK